MMMPNPVNPPPVIAPSSVWVKPYCSPHWPRMPARIENPTPEARMAMNPAQSKRYAFGAARSPDFMEGLVTREGEDAQGLAGSGPQCARTIFDTRPQRAPQGGPRVLGGAGEREPRRPPQSRNCRAMMFRWMSLVPE